MRLTIQNSTHCPMHWGQVHRRRLCIIVIYIRIYVPQSQHFHVTFYCNFFSLYICFYVFLTTSYTPHTAKIMSFMVWIVVTKNRTGKDMFSRVKVVLVVYTNMFPALMSFKLVYLELSM